jgi:hypothetical protein
VLAGLGISMAAMPSSAQAQNVEASIGRFYDSTSWTAYRLGVTRPLAGILRIQVHADFLRQAGGIGSAGGVGTDLVAFRTGREGPYLVAGVSGGLGSESSNDLSELWGSWSAGAGYDVFPVSFMSIGAQGRYRQLSLGRRDGFEFALGLALHVGRQGSPAPGLARPPRTGLPVPPAATIEQTIAPDAVAPTRPRTLGDSIVATATDAMGRPYTYGGTGTNGGGFDCSGLIQYSYREHGITVPRRSVDQAREGRKIDRRLKLLAPADILTFSNRRGGKVSHVGLYIGEGRFIHSATRGVQVSILSPDDPYGRWWYKRWMGVRRIVR